MEVRQVDPEDDDALGDWTAVLQASDRELWPDRRGYGSRDIRVLAGPRETSRRFVLLAAAGGTTLGVALMELPQRDNRHAAEVTVAVHPSWRRLGAGRALVARLAELAAADGRTVLNSLVDVPRERAADHASLHFAPAVGFRPSLAGNSRHLTLPVDGARLDELRTVVGTARAAPAYRTLTFDAPWPDEFLDDEAVLLRYMSTDEPAGDGGREAEVWDAARIREYDQERAQRDMDKLVAVVQHVASGHVVALSEIVLDRGAPREAEQQVTVVHPDHRGHRLGLAVKIANIDRMRARAPSVVRIVTGNAQVNAPMIAVNDMLGFVVAGESRFWQKDLGSATGTPAAPK